tara:strand:- start:16182 stop:16871 length:690 start_codon:yes stop_codon:yes gene_type:complete
VLDLLEKKTLNKVLGSFYQKIEGLRYEIEIMEGMLIITAQKELLKEHFAFIDITLHIHIDLNNMDEEDRLLKEASLVTRTKKGFSEETSKIKNLELLFSNTSLSQKELEYLKKTPSVILVDTNCTDWVENKEVNVNLDIKNVSVEKKESNQTIDNLLKEIAAEKLSEMISKEMNRNPKDLLFFINELINKQARFMDILKKPNQIIRFLKENKNETEKNLIDFSILEFSN